MILGYQKQWEFLKKMHELEKIPHALLFYGKDTQGMNKIAFEFIKLLNGSAFGENIHPDLFIVEPEEDREIKISQIRALHSHLSLRAYSAPFKAVIINKAHCLNQDAQSAFLKLLEEPKGKTVFILITEYQEMLLPTILSRIERIRFYGAAIKAESVKQKKIISEMLKIKDQDIALRFQYAKELAEEPQDIKEVLETWLIYFREMFILSVNSQSKDGSQEKLSRILKLIQKTDFLISTTNVNLKLALEILMLEL